MEPTNIIKVDIVDKTPGQPWNIIGACPTSVVPSGGLHVYRGKNACVRDCESDAVICTGTSLRSALVALANLTGMTVELTDEYTDEVTVIAPITVGAVCA